MTKPKAPPAAGKDSIAGAVALGSRKVCEAAKEVADLLTKALEIAKNEGSVGWVTAWLDSRDELEGYGYTVELQEERDGLESAREEFSSVYPVHFPLDLSLMEQLQVEEFFRNLRAPKPAEPPKPGAPVAGPETPMVQTVEELLAYCRGFKLEEFRQVLLWMDGHGWGELPFGPTDRLKEKVADLLETEKELRAQVADLEKRERKAREALAKESARLAEVSQALVDTSEEAGALRLQAAASPVWTEEDPRLAFTRYHLEEIPLEALEWIVRVVRGEEPPFSPDHLETLQLLKEAGEVVGFIRGKLSTVEGFCTPRTGQEVDRMVEELSARVEPLLQEAGLR